MLISSPFAELPAPLFFSRGFGFRGCLGSFPVLFLFFIDVTAGLTPLVLLTALALLLVSTLALTVVLLLITTLAILALLSLLSLLALLFLVLHY